MTAEQLLKEGQLDEALKALFQVVRDKPADAKSRRFLFQLLSVLGDWKRADTQLQVLGEMDSGSVMLGRMFLPVKGHRLSSVNPRNGLAPWFRPWSILGRRNIKPLGNCGRRPLRRL